MGEYGLETVEEVAILKQSSKNKTAVRVLKDKKTGEKKLDIRIFFAPDEGEDMIPTKKGIMLSKDMADELVSCLPRALEVMEGDEPRKKDKGKGKKKKKPEEDIGEDE